MDHTTMILISVITAAVVLQALAMLGIALALMKTKAQVTLLAEDLKSKTLPMIEQAHALITDLRPKIDHAHALLLKLGPKVDSIAGNLSESTALVRGQMGRLDVTVSDVIDRSRLQIIRADELISRTMDRVEETTETLHRTVNSPIRQLSGILQALTTGLEVLLGQKRRRNGASGPQDELFI